MRNTHPIYAEVRGPDEATENFDVITYEKGASVVRMIERWLGKGDFRKGVRRYIRRHRESNARAADLWRALEEASGRKVEPVVRAWIERPGFPLVTAERRDRAGRAFLELRQERFFASPKEPDDARRERWPIPLVVRVRRSRGRDRLETALMTRTRERIDLGASDEVRWTYANAFEGGFFRPIHSGPLLAEITAELGRLEPSERMGLVGHQWAGLRADRAPLGDFLGLVEALGDESEPEVLQTLVGPLVTLVDSVAPAAGEATEQRLASWIAGLFAPALEELGWDAPKREKDTTRMRRAILLRLVGDIADDPDTGSEAARRVRGYLRDRASLEPNLATAVVEIAARNGDKRLWERYLRTMKAARTPQERTRFEMGLTCFSDPALIERTLEGVLGEDVPTQDVVLVLVRLLGNPAARQATWDFVRGRWSALEPRIAGGLAPRLVTALPALQTRAHRAEVARFFRAHPLPTAQRALRQALESFDLGAELRRRTAPQLARWLAGRSQAR
jgi:puromycin-sensitive aminopeptidase